MFKSEDELREACRGVMIERGIRTKYFSFLYSTAKDGVDEWDYNRIYNKFILVLEKAIRLNLV